ncbi:coiled-coil domain-containing protein, putative [Ixodes scapularis]|uniref:Coiled-coil domain-containing protein, putative n=1 Tax=Ixodes scapularis TaxID=6945 RepID=B7PVX4_IXOSC|nr:coiled-coil domain-containing protein, putative [Ixodes scapularis]|eukprot:XP_002408785.1 coiled-coil domain-containing protein, putative [Ixodes scapularis]
MAAPKKYGLILPKKLDKPTIAKSSIFDDDSDDEHDRAAIEKSIKKESMRNLKKMQTQLQLQKAMEEDPTVFEYDEVYDDLKRDQEEKKQETKKDSKPRYIEQLLKAAENRKKEGDRRMQRKIQKERDQEGEVFADKEAYVTQAYRKKMQEMQEEEEKEMRRQRVEDMMDVTKQKDLTGFYRHLLKQSVGEEKIPENTDKPLSSCDAVAGATSTRLKGQAYDSSSSEGKVGSHPDEASTSSSRRSKETGMRGRTSEDGQARETGTAEPKSAAKEKRTYRTRKTSDPSEDEEVAPKSAVKQEPASSSPAKKDEAQGDGDLDADSDFSVDSADSSDEATPSARPRKSVKKEDGTNDLPEKPENEDGNESAKAKEEAWIALFKKRTVGDALEAAKARYLERKAAMDEHRAAFGSVQ